MNNNNNSNRGNNNRRRGRGNRQQGGGNQNRIDSRARGNAPQMLDKYKKLAQDAAHHGDRVQQEYYLQFADHYFRVIADSRPRGDEQQQRGRRDEQDFSNDDDGDEDEFAAPRQSREDRPREDRQRDDRPRDERQDRQRDDRPREERQRDDRPRGDRNRTDRQRQPRGDAEGESDQEGGGTEYEPADNPFVRPARTRGRGPRQRSDETAEMTGNEGEIDASALPPSFSAANEGAPEAEPERATRKLPPRRRRKPEGDADEAGDNLTAVG